MVTLTRPGHYPATGAGLSLPSWTAMNGAHVWTRTRNLPIRSRSLYPVELLVRGPGAPNPVRSRGNSIAALVGLTKQVRCSLRLSSAAVAYSQDTLANDLSRLLLAPLGVAPLTKAHAS